MSLPPPELEALLLERLRRRGVKRLLRLTPGTAEPERLGPGLKASGEVAWAKFMRMIDEGDVPRAARAARL